MKDNAFSRRDFLGTTALGAVGVLGVAGLASSCAGDKLKVTITPPLKKAVDGKPIRAGIIGCGGRGTGAVMNFLDAGDNLELVAAADLFPDKMESFRKKLKEAKGVELPDDKCYLGFDAYQKVLAEQVDYIILATPPHFRPEHFEAAVKARKNVFMEKPVAVDPVGARRIMVAGKQSASIGLSVVAGTQRRHQWDYLGVYEYVKAGAIGDLVAANAYWNMGKLWHVNPRAEWTEMENMLRNWVNWMWLSGDHIVEQHVHNLDVVNWFKNDHPVKAVGFGSRHRRVTGDQYDNFSVDFVYRDGMHMHSMCRQINGTAHNVSEYIRGTKGYTNGHDGVYLYDGTAVFENPRPETEEEQKALEEKYNSPYVQEHVDLVTAIRKNEPLNEAEHVAVSTLTGIMGRISAYTGREVTWEEMMNSEVHHMPDTYVMGTVTGVPKKVPVPGEAAES